MPWPTEGAQSLSTVQAILEEGRQSRPTLCAPLAPQCQVWAPPSVDAQTCLLNGPLGALHPSPHPEPFFRVAAKNADRGQEGMSCLSKVYVTLHEITITLLRDRRTLVSLVFCSVLPMLPDLGCSLSRGPRCSSQPLPPPDLSGTGSRAFCVLLRIAVDAAVPSSVDVGVCGAAGGGSP